MTSCCPGNGYKIGSIATCKFYMNIMLLTAPSHFVTVLGGGRKRFLEAACLTFNVPGRRAQLRHLPSPGMSGQSQVQGRQVYICFAFLVHGGVKNSGSGSTLSRFKSWSSAYYPGKGPKALCVQASSMETGLLGGCYETIQVKCSTQSEEMMEAVDTSRSVRSSVDSPCQTHTLPTLLWRQGALNPVHLALHMPRGELGHVTSLARASVPPSVKWVDQPWNPFLF